MARKKKIEKTPFDLWWESEGLALSEVSNADTMMRKSALANGTNATAQEIKSSGVISAIKNIKGICEASFNYSR